MLSSSVLIPGGPGVGNIDQIWGKLDLPLQDITSLVNMTRCGVYNFYKSPNGVSLKWKPDPTNISSGLGGQKQTPGLIQAVKMGAKG